MTIKIVKASNRRRNLIRLSAVAASTLLILIILDLVFPPPIPDLANDSATVVLASDGSPLRAFSASSGVWRYHIDADAVSPLYLQALLGYEDRWFYYHPGVNPFALLRATSQAIIHGEIISGGSTLTMQVARLLDPTSRSAFGKIKQMLRALQIERRLSKREILNLYLNIAPFGGTISGVEAASWAYLAKPSRELSHAEAALLAVLPQAPSRLRPDRHPQAAQAARDKVLIRLATLKIWPALQLHDAQIEPVITRQLHTPMLAPLLAQRLHEQFPNQRVIRSTINANLQRMAEQRVKNYLAALPPATSAAILVVDNDSMDTLIYVGSGLFADAQSLGHVDMVRAIRSPGSTLKPALYAMALDDGLIHSQSLLSDVPQSFGDYRPSNFGDQFYGPVSASQALQLSLNVPAVALLERISPRRFAARLDHAQVTLALPRAAKPNLSIILGGVGSTMQSLIGNYRALARNGKSATPRFTSDEALSERQLMSADAAFIVRTMLLENPSNELGYAQKQNTLAWKTGTSYGFRDAWALAASAQHSIAVWIGRPDGTPMPGQYGAITALPLLTQIANSLPRNRQTQWPAQPVSVKNIDICWPLGSAAENQSNMHCQEKRKALAANGVAPPTFARQADGSGASLTLSYWSDATNKIRYGADCRPSHASTHTISLWPAQLQPWLSASQRKANSPPAWSRDCKDASTANGQLNIEGIAHGTRLRRAPATNNPPTLKLQVSGASGAVDWLLDGLLIGQTEGSQSITHNFSQSGKFKLVAVDASGGFDQREIEVLR